MQSAIALLKKPLLWPTALRQGFVLVRPGAKDYFHFRMVTQYGGDGGRPQGNDMVQYLEWVRAERRRLRASAS